jgi:hypothetical protein
MYEESRLWPPIRFDYIFTDHATIEMRRRRLQEKELTQYCETLGNDSM